MLGTFGAAWAGLAGSYEALLLMKSILEFNEAKHNPKSTLDYRKAKLSTTVSKLKPKLLQQKSIRLTRTRSNIKRNPTKMTSSSYPEDNPRTLSLSTSLEKTPTSQTSLKKTTSLLPPSKAPKTSGPGQLLYAQANHDGHKSNREKAPEYSRHGIPDPNLQSKVRVDPLMIFLIQDDKEEE